MLDGAIYQDGKVALQYYAPVPKMVQVQGVGYVTDVRHSVSLLWANEEHVPSLLELRGGCCGKQRQMFTLAPALAVKVWNEGHY